MNIINNAGFDRNTAPKLETQQVMLYTPQSENDWRYSHHPFLTWFKGRFYAMWSSGRVHEDFPGQRVMLSSSADGLHWESPSPLLDVMMGEHLEETLTAGGFYVQGDQLHAYIGTYEYDVNGVLPLGHALELQKHPAFYPTRMFPSRLHRHTRMLVLSSRDGVHFDTPVDTGLPLVPNFPPQPLHSGRLLLCGNVMFPYSDDPSGLADWHKAGIFPPQLESTLYDDSEGLEKVKEAQGWASHRCESSFYQLSDGTIQMLLRSGMENDTSVLYCSTSRDNGKSWSAPTPTAFTNDTSKFHFGMLPDGRYYFVGNAAVKSGRCPLVLSLSENGIDFNRHFLVENREAPKRFEGMCKGGVYGYPHSLVQDGKLYIIYSIQKESIAVSVFPLSALS